MNDIFKYIALNSTVGKIYYFADKVNGEFVLKSGQEDVQLFPLEETYGFFHIRYIEHDLFSLFDTFHMTFYYFYESFSDDKLTKLSEIVTFLKVLRTKVYDLKLTETNVNNDDILRDFKKEKVSGASERKMIRIEFKLIYSDGCNSIL